MKRPPVDPHSREWAIALVEACYTFHRQKGVTGFWNIVKGFVANPSYVRHKRDAIEFASAGLWGIMTTTDESLWVARLWPIEVSRTTGKKSAGLPYYLGPFTRCIDAIRAYDEEQAKLGRERLCYFTPEERRAGRAYVPVGTDGNSLWMKCQRDAIIERYSITDDQLTEVIITDED